MRRGKKWMAYLLAAAMASVTIAGCQGSGKAGENSAVLTQETEENSKDQGAEGNSDAPGEDSQEKDSNQGNAQGGSGLSKEDEEWMKNQNFVKGSTREAKEPEKANISPEDYESWNQLLSEKEISQAFAQGLDGFAYKSGSAVLKDSRGNGNYSPLSLYYTLALAGCGTKGETARQILENLGVESRKELAKQCSRLYQWYVYRNQKEKEQMEHYGMEGYRSAIRLGNSLWISDQLAVGEEYQKLAAEKFFASSYGVDFGDPDTGKRMGKWIAEKTNGVLEPELTMDPGTLMAILNTLYFYGGWAEPFSEEMTKEDIFYLADGDEITVPYLNRTEMMGAFKKGDGYTLSYLGTDNNCRMIFLLPEEGRTPEEFLESPEALRNVLEVKEEDWTAGKVVWKVPKFDFGSSYQLNDILKAMGMDRMFQDQADFGGISSDPLMVSSVIQETHIGVDEMGVEGAAYTMMALARGAMIANEETAEMILDRPFLFGIRDDSQGVWLFLGVCRNPEEKGNI